MNYAKLSCIIGVVGCAAPAAADTVYKGCSVPTLRASHNTFYVDPVKGSMSGDGSASRPWSTLAEVLNPARKLIASQYHSLGYNKGTDPAFHPFNPNAPVKAGDLIVLQSGDHGSPSLANMFNSDFITIMAAPGATPIVHRMSIISSAKWVFSGVTFEDSNPVSTGSTSILNQAAVNLVQTGQFDVIGTTSDIVFDHDTFRAAASTSGWTKYDWYNKPLAMALALRAPCGAVTNSHFYNILSGIWVTGQQVLVQGNTIEDFSNDGVDIAASSLLIKGNTIGPSVTNTADPLHSDGIQGWSPIVGGKPQTNIKVVIDSNIVLPPRPTADGYMQGISVFDGKWSGLVIQNNVVTTNHWHGIAVYGGEDTSVINNTVIAADPVAHPSWITIHDASDGTKPTALVRNNIATQIVIESPGIGMDHNMVSYRFQTPSGIVTSGTMGNANTVSANLLDGLKDLDPKARQFDMRLKSTSTAVGKGVAAGAPAVDLLGVSRTAPVDLGAYTHQGAAAPTAVSPARQAASSSP